jgi:hypothetical protein
MAALALFAVSAVKADTVFDVSGSFAASIPASSVTLAGPTWAMMGLAWLGLAAKRWQVIAL